MIVARLQSAKRFPFGCLAASDYTFFMEIETYINNNRRSVKAEVYQKQFESFQ